MPITFPAHPAAILPLLRVRSLPPSALIVGSCAPDFFFVVKGGGVVSHNLPGLLAFAVPVGLLVYFTLEALILPGLARATPRIGPFDPARYFRTRGTPDSVRGWASAALAVLLAALTHLGWDAVTHAAMWPGTLYADETTTLVGRSLPLVPTLHRASSLLGSAVFVTFVVGRYRRLPPTVEPRSARGFVIVLTVAALGMAVGSSAASSVGGGTLLYRPWAMVVGAWLGLVCWAVGRRFRPR